MLDNTLIIIPARGGSKGVPGKNIKKLCGKPLIHYTIEEARKLFDDEHICVSTDDQQTVSVVEEIGLPVPFLRPPHLAGDDAGTYPVLLHALDYYESVGRQYDKVLLLQPTSPFRKHWQIEEALACWQEDTEMVVSVKETKSNPYYILYEENSEGYLEKSKRGDFITRQQCPIVYEYNGAIYLINTKSLKHKPISSFTKIRKYMMDEETSLDIDTSLDWKFAEFLMKEDK